MSNKNISYLIEVNEFPEYLNSDSENEYGSTLKNLENNLQSSSPESVKKIWYQKPRIIALVLFLSLLVMSSVLLGIFKLIKPTLVTVYYAQNVVS